MTQSTAEPTVEKFRHSSGRVSGVLALLLAGAVVIVALLDRDAGVAGPVAAGAALAGVLAWASMLRPGLWVTEHHLVMRNMLETVRVPLAAVEELAVRQVFAVRAGERRFVSTVVGRPLRKVVRPQGRAAAPAEPRSEIAYPDYVEDRVRELVDQARARAGVRRGSDEQVALAADVRREPAWLPIGLLVACLVALVVTLLL